ncbi:MAG: ABC transporter permease [Phycisphaerales bacterium]
MYASLLTRKYLTSKAMPLIAVFAVMLCTGLVLIVWSVMGGFLNTLLGSGRVLIGDVEIVWPNKGIAYYDDLVKRLEEDKAYVFAAAPVIDTFALISLPDERVDGVTVKGVDPESYLKVVDFGDGLWWKPIETPLRRDTDRKDPRLDPQLHDRMKQALADGLAMRKINPATGLEVDAVVPGIEIMGFSRRHAAGYYGFGSPGQATTSNVRMLDGMAIDRELTLRVVPLDSQGRAVDLVSRTLPVANELRTDMFEVNKRTILMPLKTLQSMMKMDEAERIVDGPTDRYARGTSPPKTVIDPARVTTILVRAQPGVSDQDLLDRVEAVYNQFAKAHQGEVPDVYQLKGNGLIRTWAMKQGQFVAAVEKETSLLLFLFGVISLVVSILILAIFWGMVREKTKDIGILRAIGASTWGVTWVWLRYGIAIGIVGAVLGLLFAWIVVTNINPIHEWMGRALNVQVWDPRVYYFAEIPSKVNPVHAAIIAGAGVLFSLLGALVPAMLAGRMKPVDALRFE